MAMKLSLKNYGLFLSLICMFCTPPAVGDNPSPGSVDMSGFIKSKEQKIELMRKKVSKIEEEKGYDAHVEKTLNQAKQQINEAESQLKALKSVDDYPKSVMDGLNKIEKELNSAETMKVGEPQQFPALCLVLTLDDKGKEKAQKEGLVEKTGRVESSLDQNEWALIVNNQKDSGAPTRFPLDQNVGLIGSADPGSEGTLRRNTPKNMSVNAWVDTSTNKVMCLSKPAALKP